MTSIINADDGVVSGTGGLVTSADSSGALEFQTNGVTAMTISASQVITYANTPVNAGGFGAGTVMLFYQATAPGGWTQVTTQNDKALRVVSTAGGGTGGTTAFTSVFTSRTPAGTVSGTVSGSNSGGSVNATTLTSATIPGHTHVQQVSNNVTTVSTTGVAPAGSASGTVARTANQSTQSTGSGGSHTHPFTVPSWSGSISASFTGTALDFAVQYIDVIICSKD